ncbi:MAG TPA: chromate efflux transporter [Caldimonas sp.]
MSAPPPTPSFGEALLWWLKLGFISFGGPAGQIALMHQELVEHRRWISERRFLHALDFCMVLPGPEAQQLATYIGWLMHRARGGIAAGALFVLPSLALLVVLSWIYVALGDIPAIAGAFYGVKPAVVAIVAFAGWRLASRALVNGWLVAIAAIALAAVGWWHAPFPLVVAIAGVLGAIGGRLRPSVFSMRGADKAGAVRPQASVIDDDTPTPTHAAFSRARLLRVLVVALAIWAIAMAALATAFGGDAVLTRMGWFFTKAALLTFGGAYAVLPYVFQGAVEQHHWLTAGQMIDGLALGESTPGPLIMIVAFIGFVGGWSQAVLGSDAPFASGVLAASVVTFFTFLPSFAFILLGGPFVESTHGDLRFTAPLAAITAAVVGVIVNLALFFAWHVLWPHGFAAGLDWPAALIGVAAAVLLFAFKVRVVAVIAVCALAGLAVRLLL